MKLPTRTVRTIALVILIHSATAVASDTAPDNRTLINIDPVGKTHVLLEMRQLLEAVQLVMDSALNQNMDAVAKHASNVGMSAMKATPPSVAEQLPMGFKVMGRGIHEAMDNIARDARDLGDSRHTLEQLNDALQSCVACHQSFKLK